MAFENSTENTFDPGYEKQVAQKFSSLTLVVK